MSHHTVLITGASSGIGKATAIAFAKAGANIIISARRKERLDALAAQLQSDYQTNVLAITLDVQDRSSVETMLSTLPAPFNAIDVLVNNAGLALTTDKIQEANPDNWDTMIDTNIKGLLYVTRAILPGMIERGKGHVINIGSIAGHEYYPGGNIYCATKHAVKAITKNLRIDLMGTPIRVSSIDPGAVSTEFSAVRWDDQTKADQFYNEFDALQPEDIADSIVFCSQAPPHVNIAEMIVMPTCQPSANHIHRHSSKLGISGMLK